MEQNNYYSIKTYSMKHELDIDQFLYSCLDVTNNIITDIWDTLTWKKVKIKNKNQYSLFPSFRKDKLLKKQLRDKYLIDWKYSSHWVDSCLKTAFSTMKSWKKNYDNGDRKDNKPIVKRPFVRVKQTMMKIENEVIRISLKPNEFVYIPIQKRWFELDGKIGEPILSKNKVYIPVKRLKSNPIKEIGWDMNQISTDGFSLETGWIKIDTSPLQHIQKVETKKNKVLNYIASKSKKGKKIRTRRRNRWRNKGKQKKHEIVNEIEKLNALNYIEDLSVNKMYTNSKNHNRNLQHSNLKSIQNIIRNDTCSQDVDCRGTSKTCSRCGYYNKDLSGAIFICPKCSLRIDRQLNAAINIYLRGRGFQTSKDYFDKVILKSLGFTLRGAERKDSDELVRNLYEAVKPNVFIKWCKQENAYIYL